MTVISLAKRIEEVFLPGAQRPLRLAHDTPELQLLQRVRDEAHRFAIEFHRGRRDRAMTRSILDDLPGVGPARKRSILQHFGSPERFLRASRRRGAGLGVGSGFAIDSSTLITNRHVVAGASRLEVNTSDGRTHDVTAAEVGVLGDVAFVKIAGELPVRASLDGRAPPGSKVAAVGYPEGGPFTLESGRVIDRIRGEPFGINGSVLRISAEVRPGNSGGPLLDRRGRVAGVVFALELDTGFGLAMPMGTVNDLLSQAGTTSVPACGFE